MSVLVSLPLQNLTFALVTSVLTRTVRIYPFLYTYIAQQIPFSIFLSLITIRFHVFDILLDAVFTIKATSMTVCMELPFLKFSVLVEWIFSAVNLFNIFTITHLCVILRFLVVIKSPRN